MFDPKSSNLECYDVKKHAMFVLFVGPKRVEIPPWLPSTVHEGLFWLQPLQPHYGEGWPPSIGRLKRWKIVVPVFCFGATPCDFLRERCWSGCSFERGTIWRPLTNPQPIMIGWVSEECKFPCKKIHQKNFLAVCKFLKSFSVVLWKKHVATGKT